MIELEDYEKVVGTIIRDNNACVVIYSKNWTMSRDKLIQSGVGWFTCHCKTCIEDYTGSLKYLLLTSASSVKSLEDRPDFIPYDL